MTQVAKSEEIKQVEEEESKIVESLDQGEIISNIKRKQYFKDDSSLISDKHGAVYLAAMGKKEEQKKLTGQ